MGRIDDVVSGSQVFLPPEVLNQGSHAAALRVPVDESGAKLLVEREEVQFAAQASVVAAMGLFDPLEVLFQLFFCVEEGSVDALEHRVMLVAAPVGAGNAHQLEIGDFACTLDVWPLAQVDEFALLIEAYLLVRNLVNQLEFVGLVLEALSRLIFRDL